MPPALSGCLGIQFQWLRRTRHGCTKFGTGAAEVRINRVQSIFVSTSWDEGRGVGVGEMGALSADVDVTYLVLDTCR